MLVILSCFIEFVLVFFGVLFTCLQFPEQATLLGCCAFAVVVKPNLVSGFLRDKLPRYVDLHCIYDDIIGAYFLELGFQI